MMRHRLSRVESMRRSRMESTSMQWMGLKGFKREMMGNEG